VENGNYGGNGKLDGGEFEINRSVLVHSGVTPCIPGYEIPARDEQSGKFRAKYQPSGVRLVSRCEQVFFQAEITAVKRGEL
jgi:hypothetical protein